MTRAQWSRLAVQLAAMADLFGYVSDVCLDAAKSARLMAGENRTVQCPECYARDPMCPTCEGKGAVRMADE